MRALTLILIVAANTVAAADNALIREAIGFARLAAELGDDIPTGAGIEVVQIEAAATLQDGGKGYAPDSSNAEFDGKPITDVTGIGDGPSGHATAVGRIFFGNATSIAPGIPKIDSYVAAHWYLNGFLLPKPVIGSLGPQPAMTSARVGNHSFVGSFDKADVELLRRLDWVIATDEFVQVVGFNGSASRVAASAFNVIAVDHSGAARTANARAVDELYTAGRSRPHLVVPESNPSRATPWVAAAVALLIELGEDERLSNDPVSHSCEARNGRTIFNAQRSEVIKAALMAGAARVTTHAELANISDYRAASADRTSNGLDRRYGAGQLDVDASYRIIAAGEQNSREDRRLGGGRIETFGFDYDPEFGGAFESNDTATYTFRTDDRSVQLAAALVWNLNVDGGIENIFVGAATLHDLNLSVHELGKSGRRREIARADGRNDNSEHLWLRLNANTNYELRVTAHGEPFRHDYALAWRLTRNQ